MGYEVVTKLKCVKNEKTDGNGSVLLTVGEIYNPASTKASVNSVNHMVFNDVGDLCSFDKSFFEIVETKVNENRGWMMTCNDCGRVFHSSQVMTIKGCPWCAQKFDV